MNIETVNELIQSLESAGELSIRETKVMALAKAYHQLAAENVALKSYIRDECYVTPPNSGPMAEADLPAEEFMPDIPATDRIVAGIKADGVEEFIGRLQQHVDEGDFVGDEVAVIVGAIDCGKEFFEQLREGADK
ncbi:hypothetical protein [Klebsiella pneumoniae]|nr:hypothetical protein [Klebsiella pneumoniae]